jgi:GABA(A) receptor-associated protein
MGFKENFHFDLRKQESKRIMTKYPDKVPIICEKLYSSDPDISKIKYLIPHNVTIGHFIYSLRNKNIIEKEKGIFILVNGFIPTSSNYLHQLYNLFKEDDGFLYINYSYENVFGFSSK